MELCFDGEFCVLHLHPWCRGERVLARDKGCVQGVEARDVL
jgi:hypothetical protein